MKKNKLPAIKIVIWFFLSLLPLPGLAQERILSFDSDIRIHPDASMTVSETIRVRAEGQNIRRGIYRDFPTRYTDRLGNAYRVGFRVLNVTRDGTADDWRQESLRNGVRVYIGNRDVLLPPGEYTYRIEYETTRQIGFFDNHDELYWNVTGNGWGFTIEQARARVSLPDTVPADNIVMEGYTGPFGAAGQDYTAEAFAGGGEIASTRSLSPREGLTLVLSWPKGIVTEPDALQKTGYLLFDNRGLLLSLVTLAGVLLYMYLAWSKVGRDPKAGVIFPHYEPPEGYSPASLRYITRMGYDNRAFTAALINLAVKGYLSIDNEEKTYTLTRRSSDQPLAPGEKIILANLLGDDETITLDQEHRKQLLLATQGHHNALQRDYLNKYFFRNTGFIWPSLIGAILMFIVIAISGDMVPLVVGIFVLIALLHGVFFWLIRAPSQEGRRLMDKVEGFKLYLEVAEKDDLNLRHPPELTPELFEAYLPYAIALDVEQAWAEHFTRVFAELEAKTGTSWHPLWYAGHFNIRQSHQFSKDVGKGFAAAVAAASAPPASASGAGGGGSSGGGGGGGGGGGW